GVVPGIDAAGSSRGVPRTGAGRRSPGGARPSRFPARARGEACAHLSRTGRRPRRSRRRCVVVVTAAPAATASAPATHAAAGVGGLVDLVLRAGAAVAGTPGR